MGLILPRIKSPADLRELSIEELDSLASEIRERIIGVVSAQGGHLASNLGMVELTIALHRVFDFLSDRLLWDVGHQAYVHKILTGRNDRFDTIRKTGGLSGFPNIDESPYDLFSVGHAGTAIATAVGMARGASMMEDDGRVVAVVGDASIFNGVAFEGLNQAGTLRRQLLVILNDNAMGIAPSQGGMAEHLAKFRTSRVYEEVKKRVKKYLPQVPLVGKLTFEALDHLKEGMKATLSPHQIFEQLGFIYVGPTDGHDVGHLIELLDGLKDVQHPVLLHVHTEKGRGADFAMAEPTRFHSPKPFKVEGRRVQIQGGDRSYTEAFADAMIDVATEDKRVFALTAAMPDGTGLAKFQGVYPERYLDGGIAESGTVDIAAGMCKAGMRPIAAIYSTFLQRAFDQVFQEVALQGLPVMFCLDRAGLVGGDGAVHHGFLDIAFLRGLPKMVLMSPGDGEELVHMLRFGLSLDVPSAIRYPRASVPIPLMDSVRPIELGRSVTLRDGKDATILAYGSTCRPALDAAMLLRKEGIEISVVNARFAKPVDSEMVADAFASGAPVITAEEHSPYGGFGAAVLEAAQSMGLPTTQMVRLAMPADEFVSHGSRSDQLRLCMLDTDGIAATVRRALSDGESGLKLQRVRGSVRSAG
ncbi:MAG: 1-deoxy-D-xylulose-5-phosphate synthase [Phycisphaerales bacterium]|nr:1-deoxy-D-xylulose-5-phosphate synthase [Phycisphaerales bacterium]MCB9854868.1 1-deoxy-D-xylulose-5-phosphate synthase [Phycisphaerales bacterium]MCB9865010.1 1-deoxy-D-xylulose-5-phosphate synthase [Phycisphaerales bacterium]